MRITKVTIETDEGVTLIAEGKSVYACELEWLADIVATTKLGAVRKELTGFGHYRVKLELACAGYREPNKPPTKLIE